MKTTDEQLKKDFKKKKKTIVLFLCAVSIVGIIDGLFVHLLNAASEKIVLSGGLALSFYSIHLMVESKKLRTNGKEFDSHVALTPKRYKWGSRGVLIGFMFQLFGIWLNLFGGSIAVASSPLVENLSEGEKTSLIDTILNDPSLLIASLALIATICIAISSWRSVITARNTSQAQLYLKLFEEYASPQMAEALRLLKEEFGYVERQESGGEDYDKGFHSLDSLPSSAQDAHRHVKYYFVKVLRLEKGRFLSKDLMKELGTVAGIDILYDAVKFFETDQKSISEIEEIEKLCGRYKAKEIPKKGVKKDEDI